MRRGEILGLKWDDINYKNSSIKISKQLIVTEEGIEFDSPKSENSNRTINIPSKMIETFEKQKLKQDDYKKLLGNEYKDLNLVNCKLDGSPIDPRYFSKIFSNLLKKKQLKHIRFHDLRHSCASLLLTAGVPLKVASEILGHSTVTITADLYSHVIDDLKRDAADKIDNILYPRNKNDN